VALDDRFARAFTNYGLALYAVKDYRASEAAFRRAVDIKPDFADAHYDLGVLYAMNGKPDRAMTHFRRAVEINPEDHEARHNLAVMMSRAGPDGMFDPEVELGHYLAALERDPDFAEAHRSLGIFYQTQAGHQDMARALKHYRATSSCRPTSARVSRSRRGSRKSRWRWPGARSRRRRARYSLRIRSRPRRRPSRRPPAAGAARSC
jgi:tetratricopeptide (TPR) repeat protein